MLINVYKITINKDNKVTLDMNKLKNWKMFQCLKLSHLICLKITTKKCIYVLK